MTMSRRTSFLNLFRRGLAVAAFTSAFVFAPALRAQETVVNLDPARTKVEFTLGATAHTVHGEFKLRSGQIRFDKSTGKASGSIVVDATTGDSGSNGRDKKMHREVLESGKYPEIVFAPEQVQGAISPHGSSQVQVSGTLRLHGQDHPMTLMFSVQSDSGNQLQAATHFEVPYEKWGLRNPSNFFLRVNDSVDIDIHAVGELAPGAAHP
jgi:polyisoprenoid-binding protein YceI